MRKRQNLVCLNGECLTVWDWSLRLGISQETLYARLLKGFEVSRILSAKDLRVSGLYPKPKPSPSLWRPQGKNLRERFLHYYSQCLNTEKGCKLWTLSKFSTKPNYGRIVDDTKKARAAHRVAYEILVAPIGFGLKVLHSCDVPSCVNPEHLRLGTQVDNILDMGSRGRRVTLRGVEHPMSKVSLEEIEEIARLYAAGNSQKAIGDMFSLTQTGVSSILRRRGKH